VRQLGKEFREYSWAPSTRAVAELAGIDPIQVLRFDANVRAAPLPTSRPGTIARALADINTYRHGGYPELIGAIADYAGVIEANVVLGAGADDLIMLIARSYAAPGSTVGIAVDPTYPLYRIAASVTGADVAYPSELERSDVALTFTCRPNNPTGIIGDVPAARPLAVDEAYYEYSNETAVGLLDTGIIVIRTFSKAFGLAGARIGYALADEDTAAELNRRQSPAPISTLSAELALAALRRPPDIGPEIEERERLRSELLKLGLDAQPSATNFIWVRGDLAKVGESLLRRGLVVRSLEGGIRISVCDRTDDDILLGALAQVLDDSHRSSKRPQRRARTVRATSETRVRVRLDLDGGGNVHVSTGAGFYDHLLEQLGFHAGFDLLAEGVGDIETGIHHTAEDAALAIGQALDEALGDRVGIARYGEASVPMDEAVATAVVDLGRRPFTVLEIEPDAGMVRHVLGSIAGSARLCLHVTARGMDSHHVAEAAFKAAGRALRVAITQLDDGIPSTKGVM
jgi:histidinol-phosphate/aromatic aminotransferase/cobyric acid decarboxylase-like protein/imidazoleglycerol phosphate dehydratase HisB